MPTPQPGILPPIPGYARYLEFRTKPGSDPAATLGKLAALPLDEGLVVGLGPGLLHGLGLENDALRVFPALAGVGCEIPSTQGDLWLWIRGEDRGEILHRARKIAHILAPAFTVQHRIDGFRFSSGLDLIGYEDGTENPSGEAAIAATISMRGGAGMAGSSFVAVERWHHDLDRFETLAQARRDAIIGRRQSDNEELEDAPRTAHVKRTTQEDFTPEAFLLRRSMPWADTRGEGLYFVAFGKSFDAFEAQLRRMAGLDDGIRDALFEFSHPETGGYYWCPPLRDGHLDLSALG